MRRKLRGSLLISVLLALTLCAGNTTVLAADEGGETLTLMCVATEADPYYQAYKDIAARFSENNDYGVTIEVEAYENEQHKTKLTTLMASDAAPDIFYFVYLEEINEEEDLSKFKVLIYPHPMILSDKCAGLLREYVKRGGYLIFGARAGLKDENGKCVMTPMPGLLSDLSGSNVTDFSFVGTVDELSSMEWEGKVIGTGVFSDILEADQENSKVLAVYTSDYYKGKPALIEHVYGKGRVLHFGGTFTRENAIAVLAYLDVLEPYKDLIDLPESCEISVRKNENGSFLFILNYAREEKKIHLKKAVYDLDDNTQAQGEILLKPFETKVYRI